MPKKRHEKKMTKVILCEFCVMAINITKEPISILYYMDEKDVTRHKCYLCDQESDKLLICEIGEEFDKTKKTFTLRSQCDGSKNALSVNESYL